MFALLSLPVGTGTVHARSAATGQARAVASPRPPVDLTQPADSTDFLQSVTDDLNGTYDQYNAFKTKVQNNTDIQFSMPVSVFGVWGMPNGGPGVADLVYSPSIAWTPFTNTAIGSGAFNFAFQGDQFWTHVNANSQQANMGLITPQHDWGANAYQFAQVTYTQTLPGNALALSVGQYSFGRYDGNQYAGNAQANFINYALAQNATQTYANAGTGGYVQFTPNGQLQFAGGLQGATDIIGETLTIDGFHNGKVAYFGTAQWTPTYLAGGTYSVLYYIQPAVPLQPSASQGISFSAAHNLNATYGLFLRANNASGNAIPIETSVAFGGIMNNPFGRNRLDQVGIGAAWDKVNQSNLGTRVRNSEWTSELYYNFTVFKALQITPDLQIYIDPALAPNTNFAVVFSIRTTLTF